MDRHNLLALLLIALVLLITPYYFQLISPPPEEKEEETIATEPYQKRAVLNNESHKHDVDIEEKHITIESPLYIATISNRLGGSIKSFKLKNFLKDDSSFVDLAFFNNKENLFISFLDFYGEEVRVGGAWKLEQESDSVVLFDSPHKLTFSSLYNGKTIYKSLEFYPDSYVVKVFLDLTNISDYISGDTYSFGWAGGLPGTEKNEQDEITYFDGFVYQAGDSYSFNKVAPDINEKKSLQNNIVRGKTDWMAVRSKYFTSILFPEKKVEECWVELKDNTLGKTVFPSYGMALGLDKGLASYVSLYLGPLEYDEVKKFNPGVPSIMNFGWAPIQPISKGVLWVLKSLYTWIPNYGLVLILFSIFVKILVYPLTKKSHQSTKEMQALQPEISILKEKHKNNPQKLNQATMSLYKERGVNPLGGCLPILIQMPLLFSLFQVFRSTIELRGAHFVLWITDLSSPDVVLTLPFSIPLYGSGVAVLPVLMGITMVFQQKMMPSQTSGQQKFMAYFMSGFMVLLFNGFSSGLNLYYTLFNVLTILQQKYLTPSPSIKNQKK